MIVPLYENAKNVAYLPLMLIAFFFAGAIVGRCHHGALQVPYRSLRRGSDCSASLHLLPGT